MKKTIFKSVFLTLLILTVLTSCTKDGDVEIQAFKPMLFSEDFSVGGTTLADKGWIIFPEVGTVNWTVGAYHSEAYAVFTTYGSTPAQPVNIAWLISPSFDMDAHDGEQLLFQAAQAYVSNSANSLEVFASTNFDGNATHVVAATWTPLNFTHPTLTYAENFNYVNSQVDLSAFTGKIHIAFKVKGSGTDNTLDGTYQIDNIRVIY